MTMGKTTTIKSLVENLPRWILVVLASLGLILLKQRFEGIEKAVMTHEKELTELKVIAAKLEAMLNTKRDRFEQRN